MNELSRTDVAERLTWTAARAHGTTLDSLGLNPLGLNSLSQNALGQHPPVRHDASGNRRSRRVPLARSQGAAASPPETTPGLKFGWLIARPIRPRDVRVAVGVSPSGPRIECLQIATGQWCPPEYATWFPVRSAAVMYAHDMGYQLRQDVQILYRIRER
ncbi:hypothetical protein FYK55_22175 [Roseiconus nitratireducens]|uniref:Uncharacterized protein n=1 Tax=Roseiconus nitratireducens TaxID=2605748 RepID=A0A5M6CXT1_9BACT|nr:hypothetical protein [Roseiconus nitratireducens]KAA5540028.1 hypothetical protein FYK55_22175 [Roseiconus nitratireducens]